MEKLLVYLAIKYSGDYHRIKKAIEKKESYSVNIIEEAIYHLKSKYITLLSENYPKALLSLTQPPFVLFYYGNINLLKNKTISIIGMRNPSHYGRIVTTYFSSELVKKNYTIMSGLALGIDAIAHQSAIDEGGSTIAVLGSGIDYCYPKINFKLYESIKRNHLIISEYPNDTKPLKHYFPIRNRLVAALGSAILVCEAKERSGTMITVGHGLELGKTIFSVPTSIFSHIGCLNLIKEGAILVKNIEDLMNEMCF